LKKETKRATSLKRFNVVQGRRIGLSERTWLTLAKKPGAKL